MNAPTKIRNQRKLGIAAALLVIAGLIVWFVILRGPTTPRDAVLDLERSLKNGQPAQLFEIYNGSTKIQGEQLKRLYREVLAPYFAGATFTSTELRDGPGQTGILVRFKNQDGQDRVYLNSAMESDAGGATTYMSFMISLWHSSAPMPKKGQNRTPLERLKIELAGAERDGSKLENIGLPPPIANETVKNWQDYKSLLQSEIAHREAEQKNGTPG